MELGKLAVFVAALCAFSATTIRASAIEPFEVDVRLRVDPSITSRGVTDRMKQEAEAIWQPYGVRLEWTDAGAPQHAPSRVSLEASLEREVWSRQRPESPAVLGRVLMNPNTPNWRPIRVSFDATERVLALRTTGRSTMSGIVLDRELAGALGRVLAHEIGHVLLGAPYHDRAGLMRANFSAEELAEPDSRPFRLTCSSAHRLGSRLRALTGSAGLVSQQALASLDADGFGGTKPEVPGDGSSCIASQPTR